MGLFEAASKLIKLLDKASNLQFIARVGAGLESIDCDYAIKKNYAHCCPEGNRNVAEHTLNDFVAFNNLNKADREIDQDIGTEKAIDELDKTVGIIGYGNMGNFAKKPCGLKWKCCVILRNMLVMLTQQVSLKELQQKSRCAELAFLGHRKLIKWLMRPL
jgi:D-3-phosphoglycerate dehydrogenase